ncbi:MAG: DUF1707 domain-containing protein [Actinobacteria bacterium]|nr:DUF1707 domain-containing protein [Actinomycetota bacterium]
MRISDADRERVTARLRDHFAEGRLTQEELDERITAALNAKTFGDLRGIMADLPEPQPVGPHPGPVPPTWSGRPVYYRRGPRFLPVALLILFAALILPGPGWFFFAIMFKVALLLCLALCIAGFVTATKFRRRIRQDYRSSWRGWRP